MRQFVRDEINSCLRRKTQSTLNEMGSERENSDSTFQVSANEHSLERNEVRGRSFTHTTGDSVSKTTTVRFRRHSACSYVPKHATNPVTEACSDEQGTQAVTSAGNPSALLNRRRKILLPNSQSNKAGSETPTSQETARPTDGFVGLNRRRKSSLPSTPMLKPEQILEGGRVEVAKREMDLDACMPVFSKEPAGSNLKKQPIAPLTRTEYNGWMFDAIEDKILGKQLRAGRQRRVSLPVLKPVDGPDSQGLSNCNSVGVTSNQSGFLSPAPPNNPIPRVQSGPVINQKDEMRSWNQK